EFNFLIASYFEKNCPFKRFVYQYERNYDSKKEKDCHIQGFLWLKEATRIGAFLEAGEEYGKKKLKKPKKDGIKNLFQNNKINFEPVNDFEETIAY
ncbi:8261_t:CDS:1, partial [Dentiscutata erythropus]